MNWEIIGYVGGICTTFGFIPQIVKAIKTKSLTDFSWGYIAVLCIGVFFWLVYGISKFDWVIISANAITFLFTLTLIVMKFWFQSKQVV